MVDVSAPEPRAPFFVAGGTVPPGSPSYVERAADRELYEALLAGEFCHVLNSRQMGKSSLAVRTIARLKDAGVRTAFVDLTRIGGATVTPEQWYAGLLLEAGRALGLRAEAASWLKEHLEVGPAQRLLGFLQEFVLARIERPVVLMLDEIDAVRSLGFSTDELFAGIRQLHNGRASDASLRRLTICLLGAALPSDLIRDPRTTPFNVGRRIELRDFTPEESGPFTAIVGEGALRRVLFWTGGHPFLTQVLGAELAAAPSRDVDALVRERYLDARARETDTNLTDVARRLLGEGDPSVGDAERADALSLYERMLRGKPVADDEANPGAARIKMSGVARVENGNLKVRNRIYARAFNASWIRDSMPGQELRRQRKAFLRGALRTGLVSVSVLAVVSALAVVARQERDRANDLAHLAKVAQQDAERQKTEAQRQRDVARRAQKAATQSAAVAESRRQEAVAAKGAAQASQGEAERAALDARRSEARAIAASGREAVAKGLATKRGDELAHKLYLASVDKAQEAWRAFDFRQFERLMDGVAGVGSSGWEEGYLRSLRRSILFRLDAPVTVSPVGTTADGRYLVTEGQNPVEPVPSYEVYDARTGRRVRSLTGLKEKPSPAGEGPLYFPAPPFVRGDSLYRIDREGNLHQTRIATGFDLRRSKGVPARSIRVSPDGATVAGTNPNMTFGRVRGGTRAKPFDVWRAADGQVLYHDDGKDQALLDLADDAFLVGSRAGTGEAVVEHDLSGRERSRYPVPKDFKGGVLAAYTPTGVVLLSRGEDRGLVVYRRGGAAILQTVRGGEDKGPPPLEDVEVTANGRRLLLESASGLSMCDLDHPAEETWLGEDPGVLSPDGRTFYQARNGIVALRVDASRGYVAFRAGKEETFSGFARGSDLVEGLPYRDGHPTILYDLRGRVQGRNARNGRGPGNGTGSYRLLKLPDGSGEVLRLDDGKIVRKIPSLGLPKLTNGMFAFTTIAVSSDGAVAVVDEKTGKARAWDTSGSEFHGFVPKRSLNALQGVVGAELSPSGRYLAFFGLAGTLFCDLRTGAGRTLPTAPRLVGNALSTSTSLNWADDATLLIGGDGVRRYDASTGKLDTLLAPDVERASYPELSPDGRRLLVVAEQAKGQRVVLVDVASRSLIMTLESGSRGPDGVEGIEGARFSRDGQSIVVIRQKEIRVYRSDP